MADLPILYSFRRCPYAMRARLALLTTGTTVELREILLRDKPEAFLTASPSATVPCLVQSDGTVIDESLDIMIWATDRSGGDDWLTDNSEERDEILNLIDRLDGPFKHHLDKYKYAPNDDTYAREHHRALALEQLADLDERLSRHSHLFGESWSFADAAIVPFVRQFANVDREWFDQAGLPNLLRWLIAFEQSDAFAAIMEKRPVWQPQNAGDPFPGSPTPSAG